MGSAKHIMAILALTPVLAMAGFVYKTDIEFASTGDFDGDGKADTILVDRATGAFRIGYQTAGTNFSWSRSRATGIESVDSVSIGRILSTNADALVAAGATANRINALSATNQTASTAPLSIFVPGIGPATVVATDIGGTGNTAHADLLVESCLNGVAPYRIHTQRNDGTNFTDRSTSVTNALWSRANSVTIKTGVTDRVAALVESAGTRLELYDLTSGNVSRITFAPVPPGSDYAVGRFTAQPYSQFLTYRPGTSNFVVFPITEGPTGTYAFGSAVTVSLSVAIGQLVVVDGTATNHLLVLATNGTASLYNFNGSNTASLLQTASPSSGMVFSAAAPVGASAFVMLQGRAGSPSQWATVYKFNGSVFTAGTVSVVPAPGDTAGNANVMLFEAEPFVSFDPRKVSSFRVGDWTDRVTLTGTPTNVFVEYEQDSGLVTGLVAAAATNNLGKPESRARYGLANQAGTAFSVFSLEPAIGSEISEVSISPTPGLYQASVLISFTNQPAMPIYYRLALSEPWSTYTSPFYVFTNTTVYYYAQISGSNTKSRVHSAAYTFSSTPANMDADGDGVPDYVEISLGLDPSGSGTDGDGDGLQDIEEILTGTLPTAADSDGDSFDDLTERRGGTDPNNSGSVPTLPITNDVARLGRNSVFDLVLTPRPYDGITSNITLAHTGTALRAYSLGGTFLAYGIVSNQAISGVSVTNPAAILTGIAIDTPLHLTLATSEQHFDIVTPYTNKTIGREVVGIYDTPTGTAFTVDYTYAYGSLGAEATNWIQDARTTYSNLAANVSVRDLGVRETLPALLFERKIGDILYSRGAVTGSLISIFPFRSGDASLERPTLDQITAIGTGSATTTAYNVFTAFTNIRQQVLTSTNVTIVALQNVAKEVYRISSAYNDASPGTYDLPVDVLRKFLATRVLDPAYTNKALLAPITLTRAAAGVTNILASITNRPSASFTLEVRTNSFATSVTTLWTVPSGVPKNLYDSRGEPFWFPATFELIPDTILEVTGYTDITGSGIGDAIEVISITLQTIPVPSRSDADGNLLPDTWELLVFGHTGNDARTDSDGDGYSDLQEYIDGTDPLDNLSAPATHVSLAPPGIRLASIGAVNVDLRWVWPADYQDEFTFGVQSTEALTRSFSNRVGSVSAISSNMSMTVPLDAGNAARFYRLILSLKERAQ